MRQWWALGRTKDGLKADPGGAPASSARFSELASEPEAKSWAEIDPTEVLGRRRGRRFGMVRNGELPKVFPAKRGGAWGRREGVLSPPKSMPNRKGARFARRRWMEADGDGGSKERGN